MTENQQPSYILPPIFNYSFDKPRGEKPWLNPQNDISDYFNYGFNEETWRVYVLQVQELNKTAKQEPQYKPCSLWLENKTPMELGGFGKYLNTHLQEYEVFDCIKNQPYNFFSHLKLKKFHIHDRMSQLMDRVILDKNHLKSYLKTLRQFLLTEKELEIASKIDFQLNFMDSGDFNFGQQQTLTYNKDKYSTLKNSEIKEHLSKLGEFKNIETDLKSRIKKSIFKKVKSDLKSWSPILS